MGAGDGEALKMLHWYRLEPPLLLLVIPSLTHLVMVHAEKALCEGILR